MIKVQDISAFLQLDIRLILAAAIPLLLALGFPALAFGGKRTGAALPAVLLSGLVAAISAYLLFSFELPLGFEFQWLEVGGQSIHLGFLLDAISVKMLALVTFVTFLVHIFSWSYMANDPMRHRYWAYLSLFSAAMIGLVLSSNLLLMFIFWELVGTASWLLIGFWHKEELPAFGSLKAFIVNRIADAGFIVALMMVWAVQGNFDWTAGEANFWIGLGLLVAAMGKSAQFPFQVWLPDAMAGPTPVSSLIHAATMVAAGVYLLLRSQIYFVGSLLEAMAFIGAITALLGAISGITQTDIKRVLAFSTISQLGFMVMGIGVGAAELSFLHLIGHAFFKCGLFLVSATVIHANHQAQHQKGLHFDAQDMRFMGGWGRKMPLVMASYLVMAASLAGLPFSSGFLSKDGILLMAMDFGYHGDLNFLVPLAAILASFMTAYYILRQAILVFFGKNRAEGAGAGPDFLDRAAKPSLKMRIPLVILACFSLWWILSPGNPFHIESVAHHSETPASWAWVFTAIAILGMLLAFLRFRKGPSASNTGFFFNLSYQQLHLDRFWKTVLVKPFLFLARQLDHFDHLVVDGLVRLLSGAIVPHSTPSKRRFKDLASISNWVDQEVVDGGMVEGLAHVVVNEQDGQVQRGPLPKPYFSFSHSLGWVDHRLVDALVNGVAKTTIRAGKRVTKLQTGKLQMHILYTILAVMLLILTLIYIFAG